MSEPLSDLEMVKACAMAMGYYVEEWSKLAPSNSKSGVCICTARGIPWEDYDPLHDKAQCFELVKTLHLDISCTYGTGDPTGWIVFHGDGFEAESRNLNRAIVTCVARMQQAKALTGDDSGKA